ncbi:MAG: DUF1207 domain-containing protein [Bacteroidetes bacterium]|nr:DUF1207 domain-containing protein [Bacteroidota bacterium]MBU1679939.1 DUF1207 domain-containing protein [Bacteroidota bacterium]MBU2508064.1 DUF1207 domain-containing protein [Bacteroidota bacterium]
MLKKIFIFIIILCSIINGQVKTEIFPDDLTIQPFTANILEPKLGFLFQLGKNELRLDIGNSIDVYRNTTDNETYSFGADLFTYSLLERESDFHFPVVAIDYLFGVNAGYKKTAGNYEYGARLRFSHISAHFVDGYFDKDNNVWRNGLEPKVYSREFIEFMPYYKMNGFRIYTGFTYVYHIDPKQLGKDSYNLGFDYFYSNSVFGAIHPFAAYDIKLINMNEYSVNHSISCGVKFGKAAGKGLILYLNYFSGNNFHGELYFNKVEYSALGINLEL